MKKHTIREEYESMLQCAQMTGIPLRIVKDAKRAGCPAFVNHRVKLSVLLAWLFDETRQNESEAMWGAAEFQNWRARREKIAHDRDARKLVLRDEIRRACESVMAELFGEVERFFVEEGPATLKGLSESQIIERARPLVESLKTKLTATALKPTDE